MKSHCLLLLLACLLCSCNAVDTAGPQPHAVFWPGCTAIVDSVVMFTNESLNSDSYTWDFANGTTSSDRNASTVYHQPGRYTVQLVASSSAGSSDTALWEITIAPPIPIRRRLALEFIQSQLWGWDWAAISQMVIQFYGTQVAQCEIVDYHYNDDCCNIPKNCDQTSRSTNQIITSLRHFGNLDVQRQSVALTFEQVRMEITQDHPVIVWRKSSRYVDVADLWLIVGYDEQGNVEVINPNYGSIGMEYDRLVKDDEYDWTSTLYCIQKQP